MDVYFICVVAQIRLGFVSSDVFCSLEVGTHKLVKRTKMPFPMPPILPTIPTHKNLLADSLRIYSTILITDVVNSSFKMRNIVLNLNSNKDSQNTWCIVKEPLTCGKSKMGAECFQMKTVKKLCKFDQIPRTCSTSRNQLIRNGFTAIVLEYCLMGRLPRDQ